ncbi:hypothetical protein BDC45DRAFT_528496 [Circinella umbellata]|nr:hypothetical protein BDC45DRAFT_528496 [Circinella umbellata]
MQAFIHIMQNWLAFWLFRKSLERSQRNMVLFAYILLQLLFTNICITKLFCERRIYFVVSCNTIEINIIQQKLRIILLMCNPFLLGPLLHSSKEPVFI